MEKVVVHVGYPLWRKNMLVALARAKELQDEGNEVTVTYCAAEGGSCVCNQSGSSIVCRLCRSWVEETASGMQLHTIGLAGAASKNPSADAPLSTADVPLSQRKELVEGVLSGLISTFRILPRDIKKIASLQRIKRQIYGTALRLHADMFRLMSSISPDRFEVFNGRHACSKSGLLVAKRLGIPFTTLEVNANKRPLVFPGHTPHDRHGVQARIRTLPVDLDLATQFYDGRRRPRLNRFASSQSDSFEMPSREGYTRLVSVFLSSQDEFESLGKSWKSPFPPDYQVMRETCERFPETLFLIRFHPNQAGIKSDIRSGFDPVEQLPNVRVFGPTDVANTYEMIDQSDVIVAFNSTVGVEACWAGKPSIMLGPSFYDALGVAYTPPNVDEFWRLLEQDQLEPKDRSGAAQLAYYVLRDGDEMKYIHIEAGKLTPRGITRRHLWKAVTARNIDTVCKEVLKKFVRAA
ncbi:Capsule polysaccharide biosynthesis protein [Allorhodopirellula solitaria]|uniref:Capsule polysaccharide biosynthesis protein n=2 Tax=Allorhodopirellula solitaria TaxID=2527987 RepID=A0A5C5XUY1_9BACT|nr:Capsule polysaccharide biosynthesis protein [Allorhodopirellula solitaria]